MILNCIVIGAGGAIGSICRYLISLLPVQGKGGFPFATLLTNVVGALLIGFIAGILIHGHPLDSRLSLFLRVGICGGFTTFSTFALESQQLFSHGKTMLGLVYIFSSVLLSLMAVMAGDFFSKGIS